MSVLVLDRHTAARAEIFPPLHQMRLVERVWLLCVEDAKEQRERKSVREWMCVGQVWGNQLMGTNFACSLNFTRRFTSSFVGDEMCGNIWHWREATDPPR